ncbi:type 3 dihydrofolate reductase [Buchnera aphidicola]|uniref:type 3 dihydrofolate reductase n=1 Tax=Buchnera aphidicola TaxID=9 RepID=UPI00346434BF
MISIIAAISNNQVIGNMNKLPWNVPKDLAWFKKHTLYKSVIMGRVTWESIGKILPMRENIVVSKKKIKKDGVISANSIDQAIKLAQYKKEIMIIGGGSIYAQILYKIDKLYLTHINIHVTGDTYFPNYKKIKWNTVLNEYHYADKITNCDYQFQILKRKNKK